MGDGGAAPMQEEIVEDEACDPTDEFITRGEKKAHIGNLNGRILVKYRGQILVKYRVLTLIK